MGSITCAVGQEGTDLLPIMTPPDTKAAVAAELRGRGLNVIAAALEGVLASRVCGVVPPGQEEAWRTLETDLVEMVKRRYFNREQALRLGLPAENGSAHSDGAAGDYSQALGMTIDT